MWGVINSLPQNEETLRNLDVGNILRKGENAGDQHFLLFSSAVFGENPRYCYSLGIVVVVISLLLLKICTCNSGYVFTIQRILSRETIQNAFVSDLCPFFDLNILPSIKHPTSERWDPHAVLLLESVFLGCSLQHVDIC